MNSTMVGTIQYHEQYNSMNTTIDMNSTIDMHNTIYMKSTIA